MFGLIAYATYVANLWGPILQMANAASAQAVEEGKKRLREFLEASNTGQQAIAMAGKESIPMQKLDGSGKYAETRRKDDDDDDDYDDDI